jgi:hypothetical protein
MTRRAAVRQVDIKRAIAAAAKAAAAGSRVVIEVDAERKVIRITPERPIDPDADIVL